MICRHGSHRYNSKGGTLERKTQKSSVIVYSKIMSIASRRVLLNLMETKRTEMFLRGFVYREEQSECSGLRMLPTYLFSQNRGTGTGINVC